MSLIDEDNNERALPVTKKGNETRRKLLDIAEETFGTKGYFNTSIVDITQLANVAQGTFYNYFSSKKEIFEELVRQLSRDFRYEIQRDVSKAKNAKEAQIIGFRTFFQWLKNHRNLYSIVQQAVLVDENLYREYYERLASGYIKGLQAAVTEQEFKEMDYETVAYSLMGISQFIGMRWVYWKNEEVPEHVLEDMITLIFDGISKRKE